MDEFTKAVQETVEQAATAADESTRLWFSTFTRLVDGAAEQSSEPLTADTMARDVAALTTAAVRDVARAAQAWVAIGAALAGVDLEGPGAGGGSP